MNRLQRAAGTIGLVAAALSVAAWQKETSPSASPRDGADLFMRKGCAACHTGPHTTSMMEVGPSLANAGEWAGERLPGTNARDYMTESIRNPTAFRSPEARDTAAMPSLNLTAAEVDAVVAYLLASDTVP